MHLLRKLVFGVGLATLVASQPGYALGLGESELHSALNQPLRADIRLNSLGDLERDDIIVRLAPNADFERAGIERPEFYSQIEFDVRLDHSDGPHVRVTTDDPVREPYLTLLVEVRWSSGRLLREYTLLLDLPTYDDERESQPVEAATPRESSGGREQPARQADRPQQREQAPQRGRAGSHDGDTYSVSANDTLWEIALQTRPDSGQTVQQTMVAIQRKNPDAFINGNINMLREGQVLRLPSRNEISGQERQAAVREVAQQNQAWSDGAMGAQLDAGSREGSAPSGAGDVSGQVRLAAPNQGESGDEGQSGGESAESGEALEAELAATQEELDKSRRENSELSARVEELEEQIDTMESLIEASNEQLRTLQASAEQTGEAEQAEESGASDEETADEAGDDEVASEAGDDAAEETTEEGAGGEDPSASDEEDGAETSEQEDQAVSEEADESEQEQRNDRVVRSLPQDKSLLDHLMDNLLWLAGAVLVVLLGVAFVLRRRQQGDTAESADEELFEPEFDEEAMTATALPDEDEGALEEGIDIAEDATGEAPEDETLDAEETVEAETGDVVGEADIYIAYGKLDQAEELLLKGLDQEPDSPQVLSKLLEVYAENRDVQAFDRHYATLLNTDDRGAIQRAGELRDSIPGAGEFDVTALGDGAGDVQAPATDDPGDGEDFQFDLDESFEEKGDTAPTEWAVSPEADKDGASEETDDSLNLDEDFNFDLDDDFDLDGERETVEPATTEKDVESSSSRYDLSFDEEPSETTGEDDDFSLDFDFDSDEGQESEAGEPSADKGVEDTFPELDLKLEDEELSSSGDAASQTDEDDWNLDDSDQRADPGRMESLDEELSLLDEETPDSSGNEQSSATQEDPNESFSLDLGDDTDDELTVHETGMDQTATSEDDQEAGQDAFADLDDVSMGDMDLSSLDEEMSDLDADLGDDSGSGDGQPSESPASEDDLSLSPESGTGEPEADAGIDEDQVFEEALSGIESDDTPEKAASDGEESRPSGSESDSEEDMDAELDFLADTDEAATKLDLARAYIDMGDTDGARDILDEVRQEGDEQQQQEAAELMSRIEH